MNPKDHPSIYKQLFSISFAYLYELNCMEGEFGIESPKTINRCAGVLACNIEYC